MTADELQGVWKYVACEVGGQVRSEAQLAQMAPMVLAADSTIPGWDGIWGIVTCGHEGGQWTEERLLSYCRFIVLDTSYPVGAPGPDFYFWAGGKFHLPSDEPLAIDLQQHWRGEDLPSLQLGICGLDGGRLHLCIGSAGDPRPYTFHSEDHVDQSCGVLVRLATA